MQFKRLSYRFWGIAMLLLLIASPVFSQPAIKSLLDQMKTMKAGTQICYRYNVDLYDMEHNKLVDSIRGCLYKDGKKYLDSSNAALTLLNGKYCFKIDFDNKRVSLYDMDYLKKKLHTNPAAEAGSFVFPDSDIVRNGKVRETANSYEIELTPRDTLFSRVMISLSKSDNRIDHIVFESEQSEKNKIVSKKRFTIYQIQYKAESSVFDLNRFFNMGNKKPIINKKYAQYKLFTITG